MPAAFRPARASTLGLAISLLALVAAAPAAAEFTVLLTIESVEELDCFDTLCAGEPGWFAIVDIDGQEFTTNVVEGEEIQPNWEFESSPYADGRTDPIPVQIRLYEFDGFTDNDVADISSENDDNFLDLVIDPTTCTISGDLAFDCDVSVVDEGGSGAGDDDARIGFRIELPGYEPPVGGDRTVRCRHEPIHPQPGDTVRIEAEGRTLGPIQDGAYDVLEIYEESGSGPVASAMATDRVAYSFVADGSSFTYGCRVEDAGNVAWSGWRMVAIGDGVEYDNAIPVLYTGARNRRVDVVFVADEDSYPAVDDPVFLTDVQETIEEAFIEWDYHTANQHDFNFWIATERGKADGYFTTLGIPRCGVETPEVGWADAGVVLHTDILRDCAPGGGRRFSTEPPSQDSHPDQTRMSRSTTRHEFGHRPFGLADEYAPDGGYFELTTFPNLYEDAGGCEDDAPDLGRGPADCRSFVGDRPWWFDPTWHLSEPTPDLMAGDLALNAADLRRMDWILEVCRMGRCGGGGGLPSAEPAPEHPGIDPLPVFDLGDGDKSFVLDVAFSSRDSAALTDAEVRQEPGRAVFGNPPLLRVEVHDADGALLRSFDEWHPLWIHAQGDDGAERLEITTDAAGQVVFPFVREAASLSLTDVASGAVPLDGADLRPAVRDFCVANPADPDCELSDLEALGVGVAGLPPFLLFGDSVTLRVDSEVTNNGPSSPTDVVFALEVEASPGVAVTDPGSPSLVPGVAIGELRVVSRDVEVTCLAPGAHEVTFASTVSPEDPWVVDAIPANDVAERTVIVDCAIPVTINISPGQTPNPVHRRSTVPVAVLSTAAGEYGNPLTFDATAIDVGTVRFGPADGVAGGTGAPPRHGGHVEDQLELDDTTRDGDADLTLHFRAALSGIAPTDSEACVFGRAATMAGSTAFFGCGPVVPVP